MCVYVGRGEQNFEYIIKGIMPLLACLCTYLLTPWSRVLPEKLTGTQLVKKLPASHGTRRFITTVTTARHLSLSWATSIQSIPSTLPLFLKVHFNTILSSISGSFKWSLSLRFPHPTPARTSSPPLRATRPAHLILLDLCRFMQYKFMAKLIRNKEG